MTDRPRPGTPALADCAAEQLHLSGRIQAHGTLVAADRGDHRITYAAANVGDFVGVHTDQLFDRPLMSLFAAEDHPRCERAIEQVGYRPSSHDLYGIRLAAATRPSVDVVLHQADGQIVVEIEPTLKKERATLAEVLDASQAMSEATSVPDIEADIVRIVRALTGFDRAMVYRFHEDEHGEIVAEDCPAELPRYLGHHFPASDIPAQARDIYLRKSSRYIPDVDGGEVEVIASPRMGDRSLDLRYASLRSVSPFHLDYMRNMGTAASVSFSISREGRLTRLVSCTSKEPRWLSPATLRSCELVVLQAKLQIEAAERISALHDAFERESIRGRLRISMAKASSVVAGLTESSRDLLELCRSDGAAALVGGQYRSVGAVASEDAVRGLIAEIRACESLEKPFSTNELPSSTANSLGAAGCLLVTLGETSDFLVWFRRELPKQLRWLGDPRAHTTGFINPKRSFDTWIGQVRGTSAPWTDTDILAAQLVAYEVDSAQLSRAQAELAYLGLHDPLTGLPNRRHLTNVMTTMLANATPTSPVAALFIDLNRFKEINDEYGHDIGDLVLCETARRITEVIRASDVVGRANTEEMPAGRLGGDEFVVLLAGTNFDGAERVADRIRQSLREPFTARENLHLPISAAVGVALATGPEEPEDLLKRADAAMYTNKKRHSGRSR